MSARIKTSRTIRSRLGVEHYVLKNEIGAKLSQCFYHVGNFENLINSQNMMQVEYLLNLS